MGDEYEYESSNQQNSSLKKRLFKFVNETPPSLMMVNNKHPRTELPQKNDYVGAMLEPENATTPRIQSQPPSTTTTTTTTTQPSYTMRVLNNVIEFNNSNHNHYNIRNHNDNDSHDHHISQSNNNNDDNDQPQGITETDILSSSSSSSSSFSFSPPSTPTTPSNSQIPVTTTTTTTTSSTTPSFPFTISIPTFTPPNPSEVIEINDNNEGTRSTPLVIDLTQEDAVTPLQNSISDTLSSSTTTTTSSSSSSLPPLRFGTTRIPVTSIPILNNELINSSLGNLTTILSYISRLSRSNSSVKSPKPEVVIINEDNDENKKPPANVEIQEEKKKEPVLEENILSKLTCSICLENVKAPTATTCGHIYCQKCIESATKKFKFCPLCKKKCTMSSLIKLYS